MKQPKEVQVILKSDVRTSLGTVTSGTQFQALMLDRGTNWAKIKLPNGIVKTLLNFEASWKTVNP